MIRVWNNLLDIVMRSIKIIENFAMFALIILMTSKSLAANHDAANHDATDYYEALSIDPNNLETCTISMTNGTHWENQVPRNNAQIITRGGTLDLDSTNAKIDTLNIYGSDTQLRVAEDTHVLNLINDVSPTARYDVSQIAGKDVEPGAPKEEAKVSIDFVGNNKKLKIGTFVAQDFDTIKDVNFVNNGTLEIQGYGKVPASIQGRPASVLGEVIAHGAIMFEGPIGTEGQIASFKLLHHTNASLKHSINAREIVLGSKHAALILDATERDLKVDGYVDLDFADPQPRGRIETLGNGDITFNGQIGAPNEQLDAYGYLYTYADTYGDSGDIGSTGYSTHDFVYVNASTGQIEDKMLDKLQIASTGKTFFKKNIYVKEIAIGDKDNDIFMGTDVVFNKPVRTDKLNVLNNASVTFNEFINLSNVPYHLRDDANPQAPYSSVGNSNAQNSSVFVGNSTVYMHPENFDRLKGKVSFTDQAGATFGITEYSYYNKKLIDDLNAVGQTNPSNNFAIANNAILTVPEGRKLEHNIVTKKDGTGIIQFIQEDSLDEFGINHRTIDYNIGSDNKKLKSIHIYGDRLGIKPSQGIFANSLELNTVLYEPSERWSPALMLSNNRGFNGHIFSNLDNHGSVILAERGILGPIGLPDRRVYSVEILHKKDAGSGVSLTGDIYSQNILFEDNNFEISSDIKIQSKNVRMHQPTFHLFNKRLLIDGEGGEYLMKKDTNVDVVYSVFDGGVCHGCFTAHNFGSIKGEQNARIIVNVYEDIYNALVPQEGTVVLDLNNIPIQGVEVVVLNPGWVYDVTTQRVIPKIHRFQDNIIVNNNSSAQNNNVVANNLSQLEEQDEESREYYYHSSVRSGVSDNFWKGLGDPEIESLIDDQNQPVADEFKQDPQRLDFSEEQKMDIINYSDLIETVSVDLNNQGHVSVAKDQNAIQLNQNNPNANVHHQNGEQQIYSRIDGRAATSSALQPLGKNNIQMNLGRGAQLDAPYRSIARFVEPGSALRAFNVANHANTDVVSAFQQRKGQDLDDAYLAQFGFSDDGSEEIDSSYRFGQDQDERYLTEYGFDDRSIGEININEQNLAAEDIDVANLINIANNVFGAENQALNLADTVEDLSAAPPAHVDEDQAMRPQQPAIAVIADNDEIPPLDLDADDDAAPLAQLVNANQDLDHAPVANADQDLNPAPVASADIHIMLNGGNNIAGPQDNAVLSQHVLDQGSIQAKSVSDVMLGRTYNFINYLGDADIIFAPSAGDVDGKGYEVWASGFGGYNRDKSAISHKDHFSGGTIGVEKSLNDNNILGIAVTNINTDIKYQSSSKISSKNYILSAYGINKLDYLILSGSLYFGQGKVKSLRSAGVDGIATGKFNSQLYGVNSILAYNIVKGNHILTPSASLQYSYINQGSYTETGAGASNQNVGKKRAAMLNSGLGLKYSYVKNLDNLKLVPSLQVSVDTDILNKASDVQTKFQLQEHYTKLEASVKPKTTVSVTPSIAIQSDMIDTHISYSYTKSKNASGHSVSLKFVTSF